ncbi:FkbM family methyltransferase [Rhodopirellula sp. P2]|uniref:FkbM family methyltransferase n=1 Tax=Rhodopirellula sp. P2 TaxID=2127060 RepID=UPI0023677782|nr:FkbM family methyltransferase [Rhodopirellula sp. P2]WDQ15654.1 FkbM family methyltransferase [Rhodopirellula sp. P2]
MNGVDLHFPIRGDLGWGHLGDAESWMTDLLSSLKIYFQSKQDHCFVDVGVNIGQTLVKQQTVTPGGAYVGFEPNASCVAYVDELVKLNGWENVELYPVGVSQTPELCNLNFFSQSEIDSGASIIEQFRTEQPVLRRSHVAVFPLNAAGLSRPVSFLKIDVEGAELEVLRGANSVILRDRPLVSIEILPCYDVSNKFRIERQYALEQLMAKAKYRCFRILKATAEQGRLTGIERVDSIGVHGDIDLADYLWIPQESVDDICGLIAQQFAVDG